MNIWDVVTILIIGAAAGLAVRRIRKRRGSCGCGCPDCMAGCGRKDRERQ